MIGAVGMALMISGFVVVFGDADKRGWVLVLMGLMTTAVGVGMDAGATALDEQSRVVLDIR